MLVVVARGRGYGVLVAAARLRRRSWPPAGAASARWRRRGWLRGGCSEGAFDTRSRRHPWRQRGWPLAGASDPQLLRRVWLRGGGRHRGWLRRSSWKGRPLPSRDGTGDGGAAAVRAGYGGAAGGKAGPVATRKRRRSRLWGKKWWDGVRSSAATAPRRWRYGLQRGWGGRRLSAYGRGDDKLQPPADTAPAELLTATGAPLATSARPPQPP